MTKTEIRVGFLFFSQMVTYIVDIKNNYKTNNILTLPIVTD